MTADAQDISDVALGQSGGEALSRQVLELEDLAGFHAAAHECTQSGMPRRFQFEHRALAPAGLARAGIRTEDGQIADGLALFYSRSADRRQLPRARTWVPMRKLSLNVQHISAGAGPREQIRATLAEMCFRGAHRLRLRRLSRLSREGSSGAF